MRISRRRLTYGAVILVSLIVTATMLRIAYEGWRALDDINSMIVTPVTIPLPTEEAVLALSPEEQATQQALSSTENSSENPAQSAPIAEELPDLNQASLNILLLGTDARVGDVEPTRTDAIVLVHLARDTGRVSMLSIPRDLWVSYPSGGEGRINAAYAIGEKEYGPGGGAALAKSTVGELLDLKVDHFIMINFQGFEKLIDELGGINIDVPTAITDPKYPTEDYQTISVSFDAGMQRMNGERALIYARTRHADSDFGRNQRQQLVLMSIFNQIRARGLLQQITSLDEYTGSMRDYVKTDMNKSVMLSLIGFARGVQSDDILSYAINSTVIVEMDPPGTFEADPSSLNKIVAQFTGDSVATAGGE